MWSSVLLANSVCPQALQINLENQTLPMRMYSLWQCCHACSLPKDQSEETQERLWSLGLLYPHSEHRHESGDLHWSWGSICTIPKHLTVLKALQVFTKLSNWRDSARVKLYMEERIHWRKSRCVILLNIALICSKYKVGHSRFSSDGKQFRHMRTPCSQPLFRASCERYLFAQMVADILCGWNLWWESQMCLCFVSS